MLLRSIFELITCRVLMVIMLQEYSQHVAESPDLSESLVSTSVDISTVAKHSRVPSSSQDDADEPVCSMEDVIQLLQLLSAVASDTQSTGTAHDCSFFVVNFTANFQTC